jgi:hypothetical protein
MTTMTATRSRPAVTAAVEIQQNSLRQIAAIWAAAALPMGFLAWVIAPWLADQLDGPNAFTRALIACLTGGLIWQFVLVVGLVWREQRTLRWSRVRQVLWLNAPRSPKSGRSRWRPTPTAATSACSSARTPARPSSPAPGAGTR